MEEPKYRTKNTIVAIEKAKKKSREILKLTLYVRGHALINVMHISGKGVIDRTTIDIQTVRLLL